MMKSLKIISSFRPLNPCFGNHPMGTGDSVELPVGVVSSFGTASRLAGGDPNKGPLLGLEGVLDKTGTAPNKECTCHHCWCTCYWSELRLNAEFFNKTKTEYFVIRRKCILHRACTSGWTTVQLSFLATAYFPSTASSRE